MAEKCINLRIACYTEIQLIQLGRWFTIWMSGTLLSKTQLIVNSDN